MTMIWLHLMHNLKSARRVKSRATVEDVEILPKWMQAGSISSSPLRLGLGTEVRSLHASDGLPSSTVTAGLYKADEGTQGDQHSELYKKQALVSALAKTCLGRPLPKPALLWLLMKEGSGKTRNRQGP
ncbi:hypothetical protein NDU88_003634 [Pleurodeles waltl]|uniref:Uncharacterized protein n=1 Tax=Pleurodeles waltl TaxID=8319 RepID=A0AAV7LHL6_PLEWA|nr:hypothetical protein NDU88_003634 [Pleurodeles waltl]